MADNGAGVFSRIYNWQVDAANGVDITASRMDGDSDTFVSGFNTAFCRDGQAPATGNWDLGGFKIANYGTAMLASDLISLGQVQSGAATYGGTAGGTASVITAAVSPVLLAYGTGNQFSVKMASDAVGGGTTINFNGVGAKTVTRLDGTAIQTADWKAGQIAIFEYDGTNFQL